MKVTVCEMHDQRDRFERDWEMLKIHVAETGSDLVLLPEMPFSTWFAARPEFDWSTWKAAARDHQLAFTRFESLGAGAIAATRPILTDDARRNEAFLWTNVDNDPRLVAAHQKFYLPNEAGVWESTWYGRGPDEFRVVDTPGARAGFLICSELWFTERARGYGKAGAQLLLTPRRTEKNSTHRWVAAGTVSAIVGGAFSLSSNAVTEADEELDFGGAGWVIDPQGELVAVTSPDEPFVTVEIDLREADRAKLTYPRNIVE